MILWQAENDLLAVTVAEDASATIRVQSTGVEWRMGRVALQDDSPIDIGHVWLRQGRSFCEEYPGRFRGEVVADGVVRYTLLGRQGREMGVFTVRYGLEEAWLQIEILEVEDAVPSLVFPPPIESESLIVPRNVGQWIRQPVAERQFWMYPVHINMRWFGGLRDDHGWLAVLHDGFTDAGMMVAELAAAPGWLQSRGHWGGRRVVRYGFTQGGYVGLAQAFRKYALEHGLHRSLRAKIEENPRLRDLIGGRLASFYQAETIRRTNYEDRLRPVPPDFVEGLRVYLTHEQVRALLPELRAAGMERGLLVLRGWINGGYDERHPDIWPPEPALGTVETLSEVLAVEPPFVAALHDNYLDIYAQSPSFPRGILHMANGELTTGGFWAGGQAYILNPRDALAYARRNWEQVKTLKPNAMFPDTVTAVQFYQSYEPGNELTRAQDYGYKRDLLAFYKQHGVLLGSEEGTDFGIPYIDWYENRHQHVPGVSIPLWGLVYHDAALCFRYARGMYGSWLPDLLWGYPTLWDLRSLADWQAVRETFTRAGEVDSWHARIGLDAMRSHRYLADQVEEAEFESAMIRVNFGSVPFDIDGQTIAAGSYRIYG